MKLTGHENNWYPRIIKKINKLQTLNHKEWKYAERIFGRGNISDMYKKVKESQCTNTMN